MCELLQRLMDHMNRPDPRPYLFAVGQRVRVCKSVTQDGQTPKHWAGAIGIVEERKTSMLHKDHWYAVSANGRRCEFREEELDFRYAKREA
jgi:hypothetical protein